MANIMATKPEKFLHLVQLDVLTYHLYAIISASFTVVRLPGVVVVSVTLFDLLAVHPWAFRINCAQGTICFHSNDVAARMVADYFCRCVFCESNSLDC